MSFWKSHGQPHDVSSELSLQSLLKSHFFFRSIEPGEPLEHLNFDDAVGVGDGVGRPGRQISQEHSVQEEYGLVGMYAVIFFRWRYVPQTIKRTEAKTPLSKPPTNQTNNNIQNKRKLSKRKLARILNSYML